MRVTFVDNEGGGQQQVLDVGGGTTVRQFMSANKPTFDAGRFYLQVNGNEPHLDNPLNPGDVVTLAPRKIAGA